MNKILIPKNPDETIILPPYVSFSDPEQQSPYQSKPVVIEARKELEERHEKVLEEG